MVGTFAWEVLLTVTRRMVLLNNLVAATVVDPDVVGMLALNESEKPT